MNRHRIQGIASHIGRLAVAVWVCLSMISSSSAISQPADLQFQHITTLNGLSQDIFKLTSTFTVAHSITLVLAGASIVRVSPRIVEPLIAFSIAFVALTTVFLGRTRFAILAREKLATVFFFGLFHGLGFAGLLGELGIPRERFLSSLFSFNIGIEIGQLVIVLIAVPAIYAVREKLWYPAVNKSAALLLGAVGIVWGVVRIVG